MCFFPQKNLIEMKQKSVKNKIVLKDFSEKDFKKLTGFTVKEYKMLPIWLEQYRKEIVASILLNNTLLKSLIEKNSSKNT